MRSDSLYHVAPVAHILFASFGCIMDYISAADADAAVVLAATSS